MPSRSDTANSALFVQIHRRMIESGDWDKVSVMLSRRLSESGWADDVHHRSKEAARIASSEAPITARQLMSDVRQHAEASVPLAVKQEIMTLIRQYLDSQLDK